MNSILPTTVNCSRSNNEEPTDTCHFLGTVFFNSAHAVDIPYDQPTVGDVIRQQVGDAIVAAQNAASEKGKFNAQMAAFREKFFTTDFKTAAHSKAAVEFAGFLRGKDSFYLTACVQVGVDDGLARLGAVGALTGGGEALDLGIPKSTQNAFAA